MYEEDGEVEVALHGSEVAEELRDVGGGVFVEASDADEWVEDEESGLDVLYSGSEPEEVVSSVEAEEGDIEEEEWDVIQGEAASFSEVFEASSEHGECVFGAVEEDGPFRGDLEETEGGVAAGDGERELGGEVSFADLGVAAEDADAGLEPEGLDEPSVLRRHGEDLADVSGGEGLDGRATRVRWYRGWHGRPPGRWVQRFFGRGPER
jgi:hypothetical protein